MPDGRLIIDTTHVHEVGQQIVKDATSFINTDVHNFQSTLNNINNSVFPSALSGTFSEFITIHNQAFTEIFQDRENIGTALQDAATVAELNEIKTVAMFNPTSSFQEPSTQILPK